jgi:hypothetical protein
MSENMAKLTRKLLYNISGKWPSIGLGILNLKILFTLIFNYMKFFNFATNLF